MCVVVVVVVLCFINSFFSVVARHVDTTLSPDIGETCSGVRGRDDVELLSASLRNGIQSIRYSR